MKKINDSDVLVIGATGFIGRHLVLALLKAGKSIRVLVRPGKKTESLKAMPIDVRYGCLEDKSSVLEASKGISVIYNCAGLSSDWDDKEKFRNSNVVGVENLLNALEISRAKRLITISTSDVYGYPKAPGNENEALVDAGLPYNGSKVEGERIIWKAVKERNLPVTVIRPASVYGPRSMEWVVEISKLMLDKSMVLLNGGSSHAGLIYIENLTQFMLLVAESPTALGKSYNIRDEGEESWKDFVDELGKCFVEGSWGYSKLPAWVAYGLGYVMETFYSAFSIKSRPLLTRHAVNLLSRSQGFDITRAQQDLGFTSWVSFKEGMEKTRSWMRSEEGRRCIASDKNNASLDAFA